MRYLTGGQASIDRSILADGTLLGNNLGGPCIFAYSGIRIWSDDVLPLLNIAEDFDELYGEWIRSNHVNTEGMNVVFDRTHSSDLVYKPDGSYVPTVRDGKKLLQRNFDYGWTNVRTDHIQRFAPKARGFYLYVEPTYRCFWKQLSEISQKEHLDVMWEIGLSLTDFSKNDRTKILNALKILNPQMASLNFLEASKLFGTSQLDTVIEELHALKISMFFLRSGEEGSYVLTEGKIYHTPRVDFENNKGVDPTGCGNSSTAAAMFAWLQTKNPILTGIVANISSGINAQYLGIIPKFSSELRKKATETAVRLYDEALASLPESDKANLPQTGMTAIKELTQ